MSLVFFQICNDFRFRTFQQNRPGAPIAVIRLPKNDATAPKATLFCFDLRSRLRRVLTAILWGRLPVLDLPCGDVHNQLGGFGEVPRTFGVLGYAEIMPTREAGDTIDDRGTHGRLTRKIGLSS
jgi:hypothetical protein